MAELSLRNVRRSFGAVEVLHGIDLDVADGEFLVLVGPSGCGKSTLLRLIAGLDKITEGKLTIAGRQMNDVPAAERGIGMVFQSYALYPHMTVAENISFGLRIRGERRAVIAERVREVAEILQLTPLLDRKPRALSGGQRQRVAIGRALVQAPQVFLFDEPLSSLDAKLRITMRVEISRLHRKLKATSVYVTHDQVEAMTMADRIAVMNEGRIEQIGAPLTLYHQPATQFVAGFIGSPRMNFLPGTISRIDPGRVSVALDTGPTWAVAANGGQAALGARSVVGIRPEDLQTLPSHVDHGRSHGDNTVLGRVEVAEHLGEHSYLHLSVPSLQELMVLKVTGTARARDGDQVTASAQPEKCHLFGEDGRAFPSYV